MKQNEKAKKSFILYNDFAEMFALLSLEDRGRLITAIFNYVNAEEEGEPLAAAARMAFQFIKNTLDRDRAAYEAKCEKNAANGSKGGRPRKNNTVESTEQIGDNFFSEKTERFFSKPKKADNDSGTENEIEIENDIDIDSGTDSGTDNEWKGSANLSEAVSDCAPRVCEVLNIVSIPEGVPERYISERLDRIKSFADKRGRRADEVIKEWWEKENAATKRRYGVETPKRWTPPAPPTASQPEATFSTFDVDDFFAASLQRTQRMFEEKQREREKV